MKIVRYVLNIPWTLIGLVLAVISIPKKVRFVQDAIVFEVRSLWWSRLHADGVRGTTIGNVVLLGTHIEKFDLEHELIHVCQFMRQPFIHEFLYLAEMIENGTSPKNKYEKEAYELSGSVYKGK